jgi:hypothetical protein
MKSIRTYFLLTAGLLSLFYQTAAQGDLKKIKEWQVKEVESVTVDRLGNFFLTFKKGGIIKYDPNGKRMAVLKKTKPTLLEPWYHPAIFIYDRPRQKYFSYGRFFENPQEKNIEPQFAIEPYLACPTHDNRLWVLDHADYSLKNINPRTEEVIREFVIPATGHSPVFTFLREYQNFLFLEEKDHGIWIVSPLGALIRKLEIKGMGNFNFFGQELYYLENNTLRFINLVTGDTSEIKLPGKVKFALITDERLLTVSDNFKITLYNKVLAPE